MHETNCFMTLTYNEENLPENGSISKREIQLFFKKLRRKIGKKIRYFACGEYGEEKKRPHYHAIIFGYDFPDKKLFFKKNGNLVFRSKILESVWTKGYSTIGEATFQSAGYVARYVMKKRKGDMADEENKKHYQVTDKETGETNWLEPEFCLMSRKPGIGRKWLEKFHGDTDKDFITIKGQKMTLPKYYDEVLAEEYGQDMKERKWKRIEKINQSDNTPERLEAKEKVKEAQVQNLYRSFEENTK